jgi:hypothetical protein
VAASFEMQKKCKNTKIITLRPRTAADETKTQQPKTGCRGGEEDGEEEQM